MRWRNPKAGARKPRGMKQRKPSPIRTLWVGSASLYQTKDKEPIATITMSGIGFIIAWHEFVPRKITQRMPSIWSSQEAAELAIYAAHAEVLHERNNKSGGEVKSE